MALGMASPLLWTRKGTWIRVKVELALPYAKGSSMNRVLEVHVGSVCMGPRGECQKWATHRVKAKM